MSDDKPSLKERVEQFSMLQLPGQPMAMHMGTSYLVNDLWRRVQELEADSAMLDALLERVRQMREPLKAALRTARPVGEAPPNVEVYWRTGADEVAALLAMLDARDEIDEALGEVKTDGS